jgi:2-methylcitrate dehydratase PrpD
MQPVPDGAAAPEAVTRQVAEWLAALRPADIPPEVSEAVGLLAMDTLGAALAGMAQPWTAAIRRWAMLAPPGTAPTGRARIWGDAQAVLRPGEAALVNGAAAHAFELDDFHNAKLHPGAVVVPAALAMGEALGSDGLAIQTAIVAGYEVMIRVALALGPAAAKARGWHLTAVCGTFGAAAAAAHLLRLDAERTAWALGLAGTQSGGLFAFTADGTDSKRLHPGRAAQSGIMAAELAAAGLSGPTQIFEAADGGFLSAFVEAPRPARLTDRLGAHWHAAETNFKPHACCGSVHAHVDAAIALREAWQGGAVRVGLAGLIMQQCGFPYAPGSALNAQMSARYCVAVALLDGAALPAQFDAARIADPALTALARRVELVHEPAHDALYPGRFCGWVEVETAPGLLARRELLDPSGSPESPGMAAALRRKFGLLAGPLLGTERAAALAAACDAMAVTPAGALLDRAVLA